MAPKTLNRKAPAKSAPMAKGPNVIVHTANGETIMSKEVAPAIFTRYVSELAAKMKTWTPGRHRLVLECDVPAKRA